MIRSAALAAILAVLPAAAIAAEERGSLRTYSDWMIGCDNGRTCHAVSLLPVDVMEGWFLRLDRDAAATAPVQLTLMPQSETYPHTGILRLHAADADIARLTIGQGLSLGDDGLIIRDGAAVAAVLAAMRSADVLEFIFEQQPAGGDVRVSISLSGAQAALLRMDDLQRRLDTVTALVHRGRKPAGAVPSPPALPIVVPERETAGGPPPEVLQVAARDEMVRQSAGYCDDERNGADSDSRDMVRLGPGLILASVPCFSGAYNFARAYFLVDESPTPRVRPALFPRPVEQQGEADPDRTPDNVLWNADFAANSSEISQFSKGRGIADCGDTGVWHWDGRAFQTVSLTMMDSCRGIMAGYWPKIYSSREQ